MKAEVKPKEVVKHWGIWIPKAETWLVDNSNIVFSTTCPRVANVQHDKLVDAGWDETELEVKELK